MNKLLLEKLEEYFFKRIDKKTGWGKNEIKEAFKDAKFEALVELLEDAPMETP